MKFEELPKEDQDDILKASRFLREAAGQFSRLAGKLNAMRRGLPAEYVNSKVAGLDPKELIPNITGLDGAGAPSCGALVAFGAVSG